MPFGSGGANPRVKHLNTVAATYEANKARKRDAYALKRAAATLADVSAAPSLEIQRMPLADRQHATISLLDARGKHTQEEIGQAVGCAQSTVSRSLSGKTYSSSKPIGRPMETTLEDREAVRALKRLDPHGRLKDLQGPIKKRVGIQMTLDTISRILRNPDEATKEAFRLRATNRYARFTEQLWDMHMGFRAGIRLELTAGRLTFASLVYEDEFPISQSCGTTMLHSQELNGPNLRSTSQFPSWTVMKVTLRRAVPPLLD